VRASENENFAPSIFTLLLGRSSVLIRVCKSIRYRCFKELYHFIGGTTGFAPERLRDAKRVYEKTTIGRARDARQELHNAERT
jgi:hypothetical protein